MYATKTNAHTYIHSTTWIKCIWFDIVLIRICNSRIVLWFIHRKKILLQRQYPTWFNPIVCLSIYLSIITSNCGKTRSPRCRIGDGLESQPNTASRVKTVKWYLLLLCQVRDKIVKRRVNALVKKTGASHYHTQLSF